MHCAPSLTSRSDECSEKRARTGEVTAVGRRFIARKFERRSIAAPSLGEVPEGCCAIHSTVAAHPIRDLRCGRKRSMDRLRPMTPRGTAARLCRRGAGGRQADGQWTVPAGSGVRKGDRDAPDPTFREGGWASWPWWWSAPGRVADPDGSGTCPTPQPGRGRRGRRPAPGACRAGGNAAPRDCGPAVGQGGVGCATTAGPEMSMTDQLDSWERPRKREREPEPEPSCGRCAECQVVKSAFDNLLDVADGLFVTSPPSSTPSPPTAAPCTGRSAPVSAVRCRPSTLVRQERRTPRAPR